MKDDKGEFEPIILTEYDRFDWAAFHNNLDRALAVYLEDTGGSIHDEILTFIEYSHSRLRPVKDIFDQFKENQ